MTPLRNAWYVAMWAQDLPRKELVHRRILDEPILLFRDTDGSAVALADRCPHRFAPLHMGALLPDGRVRCGYHGLEFNSQGQCVRNPHGGQRIPPALAVREYPVEERHTLLWIWMGDRTPDPALIPDFSLLDATPADRISKRDWIMMEASWELITDNLLDLSHISYLHVGILGNEDTVPAEIKVEEKDDTLYVSRWMPGVRPPSLFDMMFRRDGKSVDLWTTMRWDAPGCMLNDAGVTASGTPRSEGTGIHGTHFLTPSTATSTYYHFAAARQNPLPGTDTPEVLSELSRLRRIAFKEQDEPMICAQQQAVNELGDSAAPVLLSIDAGPVRYRRVLERLLNA
jgi:vanillate O-demethylase monooxygenase subunit